MVDRMSVMPVSVRLLNRHLKERSLRPERFHGSFLAATRLGDEAGDQRKADADSRQDQPGQRRQGGAEIGDAREGIIPADSAQAPLLLRRPGPR